MPYSKNLNLDADILKYLITEKHPQIMVDRIIEYNFHPQPKLQAEKYISANEPVFAGHFPDLKMWPGVYTIEGLKQCCSVLDLLPRMKEEGILKELLALENAKLFQVKKMNALPPSIIKRIKEIHNTHFSAMKIKIKFLSPVFAGCILKYKAMQSDQNSANWSVQAEVEGVVVAKGNILTIQR